MGERERWDARYAERRVAAGEPDPFVCAALEVLGEGAGRRALDLAAGAGRHALLLANHGWLTMAWDISPEAGRILSERAGDRIGFRVVDLTSEPLPREAGPFDLVLLVNFLDRSLLGRLFELVRPGGHLVFATFTLDRPGEHPCAEFCLEAGELARGLPGFSARIYSEVGGRAGILAQRVGL